MNAKHVVSKAARAFLPPTRLVIVSVLLGASITAVASAGGCSADANKTAVKTAVDIATASCVILRAKTDNNAMNEICAAESELAPFVKYLVAARKAKAASSGAVGGHAPDPCKLSLDGPVARQ